MIKKLIVLLCFFSSFAFADVEKSFTIEGDVWKIKTQAQFDLITFCRVEGSGCFADGIGLRIDWYDAKRTGVSARVFYQEFLDKAHQQLLDYYGGGVIPPDPTEFVAYMEFLIQNGTTYNASDKTFTVTE